MEILSYSELPSFSRQATDRILQAIARANGPVVLPMGVESIAYCRRAAQDPEIVQRIITNQAGLSVLYLAIYSMKLGKRVIPMFNSAWKKIGAQHRQAYVDFESLVSRSNDLARARVQYAHREYSIEAARLKNFYERFRKISPALIVAEDNYAIIFGKLFRTRVQRLSRHSRSGLMAVRKVWPHVIEAFRDSPISIGSRRHGRKIRRLRKGK